MFTSDIIMTFPLTNDGDHRTKQLPGGDSVGKD